MFHKVDKLIESPLNFHVYWTKQYFLGIKSYDKWYQWGKFILNNKINFISLEKWGPTKQMNDEIGYEKDKKIIFDIGKENAFCLGEYNLFLDGN